MAITINPNLNGHSQRKSLASQLDRFDRMLDGLDKGLQDAITDAIKEVIPTVVAQTLQATLLQVISNPEIHALVQGSLLSLIQQAVPQPAPANPNPMPEAPRRNALSRAWNWCVGKIKAVTHGVCRRVRCFRDGVVNTYRQVNSIWRLRRAVIIALVVGAAAGIAGYAASPWVAGVVSGVSATVAALGTQLAIWARRVFSRLQVC